MNNFWNQRYDTEEFVYGREPNSFFAKSLEPLMPGKILLPGEGEGRNAVYAAGLGWKVDAFDQSTVGAAKAGRLAGDLGVQINYKACELEEFPFEEGMYDAVGLFFFHAPKPLRKILHHGAIKSLKPGGKLILEAFHTSQLGRDSGGPPSLELLFNKELLLEDFSSLDIELIGEVEENLDEGLFHSGPAKLIRFLGIKN